MCADQTKPLLAGNLSPYAAFIMVSCHFTPAEHTANWPGPIRGLRYLTGMYRGDRPYYTGSYSTHVLGGGGGAFS